MDATNEDAISKLIRLYNSGQSLNLADGTDFNVGNVLPGAVSEILVAKTTNNNAAAQLARIETEKEQARQRTNLLLERQRADLKKQDGDLQGKVNDSLTIYSRIDLDAAKNVTLSIAASMSRCSKLVLALDEKTYAADEMNAVENEDCEDFQGSIQKLARYIGAICVLLSFLSARSFAD
jgi:hypothetical protein